MKKYILFLCFIALFNACKEDAPCDCAPRREKVQGDTDYTAATLATAQPHNVLLEDITGVKCPNCPASHIVANSLQTTYPGRVVISALHAYTNPVFTDPGPVTAGYNDFRDSTANYIVTQLLDNPSALPQGGVDRKLFSGEPKRYIDYSKWSTYVSQELLVPTPVNIDITNSYNAATRELTSVIKIECNQTITDDIYLSVGITEDSIIAKQKDGANIINDYVHNRIFREILTPQAGLKINSSTIILDAKKVVIRVFKYILPAGWNENNSNVIGILHKNNTVIDVVQCTQKKIL